MAMNFFCGMWLPREQDSNMSQIARPSQAKQLLESNGLTGVSRGTLVSSQVNMMSDAQRTEWLEKEVKAGRASVGVAESLVRQLLSLEQLRGLAPELEYVSLALNQVGTDPEEEMRRRLEATPLDEETKEFIREGFLQQPLTFPVMARVSLGAVRLRRKARLRRKENQSSSLMKELGNNPELAEELSNLDSWNNFDIFHVNELSAGRPLLPIAMEAIGMFTGPGGLHLDMAKLQVFLLDLELHYRDNGYHNSMHAADVTQTLYSFYNHDLDLSNFHQLELFSTLFAAMCHDVGHPGRTNGFRVTMGDEGALTYNDRSVNENGHCSLAYHLVRRDGANFLEKLTSDQRLAVRKMFIEVVLATDMSVHFKQMKEFEQVVEIYGGDLSEEEARHSSLIFGMHACDISNVSKPFDRALSWAQRVLQENFLQGDEERSLGIPVSPLCDRHTVSLPASQVGFVDVIVMPMFENLHKIVDATDAISNLASFRAEMADRRTRESAEQEKQQNS